ncbi:MAG TPA: ClbS/DfsB family four-helix bundle protein [Thermomicrobiales bacterium]|nr:ClbS/DfsB family four-helix bundle protein [Thermomicrobiales bacterium]
MQEEQSQPIEGDMNELNRRISVAWQALEAAIAGLDEQQLSDVRDANGWAIKDHLMNVVLWERSIAQLLLNQPRHETLGVSEDDYLNLGHDGINAIIFEQHRDLSAGEVLARLLQQHEETLEILNRFTWDDLLRPYSHYLPDEPGKDNGDPILYWIMGNTAGHYDEHRQWIEALRDGR